jgi:hypothetical protein
LKFPFRMRLLVAPIFALLSTVGGGSQAAQGSGEPLAVTAAAPSPTMDTNGQRGRGGQSLKEEPVRGPAPKAADGPALSQGNGPAPRTSAPGQEGRLVAPQVTTSGQDSLPLAVVGASLSVDETALHPGDTLGFMGTGFPSHRSVLLEWDGSTTGMPSPRTESDGSFGGSFTLSPDLALGLHSFKAVAWENGGSGATAVEIFPQVTLSGAVSPVATATPVETPVVGLLAGQKCPDSLHDQYQVTGPDGNAYATWHPATHSSGCWFGHEHGDNPAGAPALAGRPVLFGYAGAKAGIDEPHSGYKVFRWDNVNHPNAAGHTGSNLLMTLHQGTSGAGRFTTVHHSVQVDYVNPNDGRELHLAMMAPFGTLMAGCGANDPSPSLRVQQAAVSGMRQVSTDKCFNLPSIPYEDWITALKVGTDGEGGWTAYFDPHFAVFQPNTYCIASGSSCGLGYSDVRAATQQDPLGPTAGFKGTKREAYLNQVWTDNAGGSTTVWTDAYGRNAEPGTPGSIAQYICALDTRPLVNSSAFGEDRDHDDGTVRVPN